MPVRLVSTVDKISRTEKAAEEARRQRRAKRKTVASGEGPAASTGNATPDPAAAGLEAEKKTTKKERKLAESKFTEQQQHKSANEASRMALGGALNPFGRKKGGRELAWMKMGSSPAVTPGRPPTSGAASTAGTPGPERARAPPTDKEFGQWEEDKDGKIQARDVLLVLESDGRASRSFVRGLSSQEKIDS